MTHDVATLFKGKEKARMVAALGIRAHHFNPHSHIHLMRTDNDYKDYVNSRLNSMKFNPGTTSS